MNCMREVLAILLIIENIKNNLNELFIMPAQTKLTEQNKLTNQKKLRAIHQKIKNANYTRNN